MDSSPHPHTLAVWVGAIVVVLLQIVIVPAVAIASALPNLMLAYAVVVAVSMARTCGFVMPFAIGLVFDLVGGGPVGAMALLLVLATWLLARAFERLDNDTLFVPIVLIIVAILLVELLDGVIVLACGSSAGLLATFAYRSLPCALYTCVLAFIMYPVVARFVAHRGERRPQAPLIG